MRSPAFSIVLLALALYGFATGLRASEPVDYFAAKQLADQDEASVAAAARPLMLKAQESILHTGIADCAQHQAKEDFSAFTIVMRLGADGRVVDTWRQGSSPLAICVQRYVRDRQVFIPPRAPFHTALEVSFIK